MGDEIESKFKKAPFGWEVDDIKGTLSAMMRASLLKVKHKGKTYRDYTNENVNKLFNNIHEFRNAKFYILENEKNIPTNKKINVTDKLLELNDDIIDVDHNTPDFQIVKSIKKLAENYFNKYKNIRMKLDNYLLKEKTYINTLKQFSQKDIINSNLNDEVDNFLSSYEDLKKAIDYIKEVERFVDHKYDDFKNHERFVEDVETSFEEIEHKDKENLLKEIKNYKNIKEKGVIENIDSIVSQFNNIRQVFNEIFEDKFKILKEKFKELKKVSEIKKKEIEEYSAKANKEMYEKIEKFIKRANKIINTDFELKENDPKEKNTNSTIKEINNKIKLIENDIKTVQSYYPKKEEETNEKPYKITLPARSKNLSYMKSKLRKIVTEIKSGDYDSIEININKGE